MKPVDLAYYVVHTGNQITPMKLQKLLYYLKVWGIVTNDDLVDGDFQKWTYGPVNVDVYSEFKSFGSNSISKSFVSKKKNVPNDKKQFIDFVLDCYGHFDALTLSSMTHAEEPWQMTKKNKVISEKSIKAYYSKLPFAKNFPIDEAKPFYPVQTNLFHAYILDMSEEDALKHSVYSSFKVYKKMVKEAKKQSSALLAQFAIK